MLRLHSSFVLAYHGCDQKVAEALIDGAEFKASNNDYDWLGQGIYFWESNPHRGLDWAKEQSKRKSGSIKVPAVVGAIVELGCCLDLSTLHGIEYAEIAYKNLVDVSQATSLPLPENSKDRLRRYLDCAVITRLHTVLESMEEEPVDTVRGIFTEGGPIYPGSEFQRKTHIQIAVRNKDCIKGVFRVPAKHLK